MEKRLLLIAILIILIFVLGTVKYSFSTNAVYKVSDLGSRSTSQNPIAKYTDSYIDTTGSQQKDIFFDKDLMKEIENTHKFLLKNKNGLPYTPDHRNLTPLSEYVRLNIDTQALGYLNLYKITKDKKYLDEAKTRLDYIKSLGENALGQGPLDGMIGYTYLYAYELTGNITYLNYGITITNKCFNYENLILNQAYACAMSLSKTYKITGEQKYVLLARNITRDTSLRQAPGGSFPHQDGLGPNAPYTAWMVYELIQIRRDDALNPDIDLALLKANKFLANRVNDNGSLNYEDANGTYYSELRPTHDVRGWTNDLVSTAYDLRASGKNDKSRKLLEFLFSHQLQGPNKGSYPDKWDKFEPNFVWAAGNPSVLRTSLIFWYLTSIPLINKNCENGQEMSCVITPQNCNVAYQELNACNLNISGKNTCIDGTFTKCINENIITNHKDVPSCEKRIGECEIENPTCEIVCYYTGSIKCLDTYGLCTSCFDEHSTVCGEECSSEPMC